MPGIKHHMNVDNVLTHHIAKVCCAYTVHLGKHVTSITVDGEHTCMYTTTTLMSQPLSVFSMYNY